MKLSTRFDTICSSLKVLGFNVQAVAINCVSLKDCFDGHCHHIPVPQVPALRFSRPSNGNYMRKCASEGQSLANAERGVGMSGFAGKIGD